MRRARPGTRLARLLPAFVCLSLACARRPEPPPLTVAHESEVLGLDPLAPPDAVTNSVLANLFEPLVSFDGDMRLVPGLALAWETADPLTWRIRLRPNVRFHDGALLTASEARAALERAWTDPASGVRGVFANVRAIEESGPLTLTFTTTRPDPLLLNRLAQVPLARRAASGLAGTGAYRLVRFTKGAPLEVEAFAGHWRGAPRIPRARFVTVPSGRAEVEALRSGSVDILRFVPENFVDEIRALPHVRLAMRAGLSSTYLWMDGRGRTPRNPLSDARVRRALSLAIDRAEIVEALSGNAMALDQTVPRGIFGHVASLAPPKHDPAEARRLLREAGWPRGFDLSLVHSRGPTAERVAQSLREMLGAVGVRLTLEGPEWERIVADWRAARLGLFLTSWRFDTGDASSFFSDCLVTRDPARGAGGWNPGYSNPALDRLVAESEGLVEPAKRLAIYEEVARTLEKDVPVVPLYHRLNLFGVSDRVAWTPRLDGRVLVAEVAYRP